METYTFDGHGINGADEYKSRLATLTDEGITQNIGNLFAAAPELLAALEYLQAMPNDPRAHRAALDAIAKSKGE